MSSDLEHESIAQPISTGMERLVFGGTVGVLYCLPVALILAGVIPFAFRFVVLLGIAAAVFAVEILRKRSWRELGFRRDTLKGSLALNGILSAVLVVAMVVFFALHLIRPPSGDLNWVFYAFYVLISCPSQEFLFRSAVFAEMSRAKINNPVVRVALSTAIFIFPHSIYHDALTLVTVAVIGVIWGIFYQLRPNFFGVVLSHAVLGAVSIAVGLV